MDDIEQHTQQVQTYLTRRQQVLQHHWQDAEELLSRLEQAKILETDVAIRFKLEKQIERLKTDKAQIEQELQQLESDLADIENPERLSACLQKYPLPLPQPEEVTPATASIQRNIKAARDYFEHANTVYTGTVHFWKENTKPLLILAICVVVLSFGLVVWMVSRVKPVDINFINETKQNLRIQYEQRIAQLEAHYQQSEKYYQQQISVYQQRGEEEKVRYDKLVDELITIRGKDIPTQTIDDALQRLRQGDTEEAEAIFKQIAKEGEENVAKAATAYRHLGAIAFLTSTDEAIAAYQRAVELDPTNLDNWFGLGVAYHHQEQYDKAVEAYQNALDINPEDDRAWNNLGVAYSDQGQYAQAIEAYQKAIEVSNDEAIIGWAHIGWGNALRNLTQYKNAIRHYEKAIEVSDDEAIIGWAHIGWGNALTKLTPPQYKEAIEHYKKATKVRDDKTIVGWAYNGWGDALRNLTQYEDAIEHYKKAMKVIDDEAIIEHTRKNIEEIEKEQK